jgi:intracellular septation protein
MHPIFEYLPLIVFFIIFKFVDVYWATGSLILMSALQIVYFLIKRKPVPKRNWIFFALIFIFGSLTIIFHDDTFLKWKVTVINTVFAAVLVISNTVFNKNLIKEMLGDGLNLPDNIWSRLNVAWALFFLLCAGLNLYVAYNYSLDQWVNFKVFGLTGLTFVFAIGSVIALYKFLPQEDDSSADKNINECNNDKT